MNIVTTVPELLRITNIAELSAKTIPKILDAITANQIQLDGEALKRLTSIISSSNEIMSLTHQKIFDNLQKSWDKADTNSISYIKKLLESLKSSGVSDNRIDLLIEKIINHEHQIRQDRNNHGFIISALSVIGCFVMATVLGKTHIETSNKKYPFWYTR